MAESTFFPKIKLIGFFLLYAFILSCNSISDNAINKNKSEILSVINASSEAWNRGSLEEYMQAYWQSDSLKFVGGKSISFGWKTTLDRYKKSYPDKASMGILEFHEMEFVNVSDDIAVISGSWHLKRAGDNPEGRFTLILKKFHQGWRIIYDHSC
ncbi:MAG: hypothetical protein AUJ98_11480 [Bacteroidetes bacterium CG2_30_33_31]|nr:MAG: hypothetical protein AUJ98_11480 [Bacteroidetes bacterium CG2_30_33_31]